MEKLKAIIVGATGMVGSYLLEILQEDDAYRNICIMTRREISGTGPKVQQIKVDFDSLAQTQLTTKPDVAFCCLGTTMKTAGSKDAFYKVDFTYCLEFAKLAKEAGCKKFIMVSALGANAKSANFYMKVKGQIEEAIAALNFDTFIIMQPSMLLGKRKETRVGESIGQAVMTTLDFLIAGPFKKYKAIHGKTVAAAMAKTGKDDFQGKVIFESDKIAAY